MRNLPFTYCCELPGDLNLWPMMLDSLAAAGAENLVFTNNVISTIADDPTKFRKVGKLMDSAGLKFVDAHAQYTTGSTFTAPDELRPMVLARHKFQLELMAQFGIKSCCFHVGKSVEYPGMTVAQGRDNVRKALEATLKEAEKLNIIVCLENIFHPLNTSAFLLELMRDFASPCLGICYDCGHANIMEKAINIPGSIMRNRWQLAGVSENDIEWENDILSKLAPHVVMCHLHDNDAVTDQHLLPGEGNVDFDAVFAGLEKCPRLLSYQSETLPVKWQISGKKLCKTWQDLLKKY